MADAKTLGVAAATAMATMTGNVNANEAGTKPETLDENHIEVVDNLRENQEIPTDTLDLTSEFLGKYNQEFDEKMQQYEDHRFENVEEIQVEAPVVEKEAEEFDEKTEMTPVYESIIQSFQNNPENFKTDKSDQALSISIDHQFEGVDQGVLTDFYLMTNHLDGMENALALQGSVMSEAMNNPQGLNDKQAAVLEKFSNRIGQEGTSPKETEIYDQALGKMTPEQAYSLMGRDDMDVSKLRGNSAIMALALDRTLQNEELNETDKKVFQKISQFVHENNTDHALTEMWNDKISKLKPAQAFSLVGQQVDGMADENQLISKALDHITQNTKADELNENQLAFMCWAGEKVAQNPNDPHSKEIFQKLYNVDTQLMNRINSNSNQDQKDYQDQIKKIHKPLYKTLNNVFDHTTETQRESLGVPRDQTGHMPHDVATYRMTEQQNTILAMTQYIEYVKNPEKYADKIREVQNMDEYKYVYHAFLEGDLATLQNLTKDPSKTKDKKIQNMFKQRAETCAQAAANIYQKCGIKLHEFKDHYDYDKKRPAPGNEIRLSVISDYISNPTVQNDFHKEEIAQKLAQLSGRSTAGKATAQKSSASVVHQNTNNTTLAMAAKQNNRR